jgi:hypothetical protein
MPTGRENEIDRRGLNSPGVGLTCTSGVQLATPCTKLVICFSVSGNLTLRMMDGNSVTINSLPIGMFTLDVQFDTVTWTGTATAVAFFSP